MSGSVRQEDAPIGPTGADLPQGWLLERDATGREALVRDRKGNAMGAWVLTGMATAIVLFALLLSREPSPTPPSMAASLIAVLLIAGFAGSLLLFAILLAFGRDSIVAGGGMVETRLDLFGHPFIRKLAVERLHVERESDSDNRNRYSLVALGEGRSLPLDSRRFTPEPVVALARWLAVRLEVPLDIDDDWTARARERSPRGLAELRIEREHRDAEPR